jgi:phosphatidylinositol alpha 1,6-mannosyltransferase
LGNVVLEAMASGLPVVAARAGGVLDHVVEGETGLLFEPENQDDLVAVVSQLVAAVGSAQRLGTRGQARAQSRSWATVLDGLLADYATLVDSRISAFLLFEKAA